MKSPNWLQGYVEGLEFPSLTKYRSDCPVCGKKNTFSVTDDGLNRMWHCFHADCNVSGRTGITLSREHAKKALSRARSLKTATPSSSRTNNTYEIPDTFVSVSRSLDAETYVKRVNAYDAYLAGRVDIRFDFKRNRAVFLVKHGNRVVDATGRSLNGRNPKWYRYGTSHYPFVCGHHSTAVVVEDCASACAISNIVTGVALMGTSLLPQHLATLSNYPNFFVALDKDATDKAVDMVRVLRSVAPTKMMILRTDLKNMDKDERDDFIRSYINR